MDVSDLRKHSSATSVETHIVWHHYPVMTWHFTLKHLNPEIYRYENFQIEYR